MRLPVSGTSAASGVAVLSLLGVHADHGHQLVEVGAGGFRLARRIGRAFGRALRVGNIVLGHRFDEGAGVSSHHGVQLSSDIAEGIGLSAHFLAHGGRFFSG